MGLQETIDLHIKQAMLQKDEARLLTLRGLKSALKYVAIEKKVQSLSDLEAQQVIQKQIKQRRESIDQFQKGGRVEMAEKELKEAAILESYLPKQLSDEALSQFVTKEMQAAGASSKKDFGRMMKILNEKLAGQADAKRISELLGRHLS